jgi:hypothetical protein
VVLLWIEDVELEEVGVEELCEVEEEELLEDELELVEEILDAEELDDVCDEVEVVEVVFDCDSSTAAAAPTIKMMTTTTTTTTLEMARLPEITFNLETILKSAYEPAYIKKSVHANSGIQLFQAVEELAKSTIQE